jgi:hypothetical protein
MGKGPLTVFDHSCDPLAALVAPGRQAPRLATPEQVEEFSGALSTRRWGKGAKADWCAWWRWVAGNVRVRSVVAPPIGSALDPPRSANEPHAVPNSGGGPNGRRFGAAPPREARRPRGLVRAKRVPVPSGAVGMKTREGPHTEPPSRNPTEEILCDMSPR